jgi:hypothetical protein
MLNCQWTLMISTNGSLQQPGRSHLAGPVRQICTCQGLLHPPHQKLLTCSLSCSGMYENDLDMPVDDMIKWELFKLMNISGLKYSERGGLTSLGALSVSHNSLTTGSMQSELGVLTNITILYLRNNTLSERSSNELAEMTSIQELAMNENFFLALFHLNWAG